MNVNSNENVFTREERKRQTGMREVKSNKKKREREREGGRSEDERER